jgi:hypothetical protein
MALAGSVIAIIVAALAGFSTPSQADAPLQFVRLKPADPEMRRLLIEGHLRSSLFRGLVDQIQRSRVIVIVQYGQCANGRFRSCVTNVDGDAIQRMVRIKLNTRVNDDRLIATLAHELQHVVEILADPDAVDAARTLALYRRIGEGACRKGLSDACETKAALEMERQVMEELREQGSRTVRD